MKINDANVEVIGPKQWGGEAHLLLVTGVIGKDSLAKDTVYNAMPEQFVAWQPPYAL